MHEALLSLGVTIALCVASIGSLLLYPKLHVRHRDEETNLVVRLVANLFVVMASLAFGLMINSSKNTFENIDANVHSYATNLILLDQSLRSYGLGGDAGRQSLIAYVEEAIRNPIRADNNPLAPDSAQIRLDNLGQTLFALTAQEPFHQSLLTEIRAQYNRIVEQRWALAEQSEGVIPSPVIALLIAWLVLIFGSYGYRAPRNGIVIVMFLGSAALIGLSIYVVLDMDIPFEGIIQISDAPLHRALAEMSR